MSTNIEINGPAFIKTSVEQAMAALDRGDTRAANNILIEMHKTSKDMIGWFAQLAKRGVEIPDDLTWTKYIHRFEPVEDWDDRGQEKKRRETIPCLRDFRRNKVLRFNQIDGKFDVCVVGDLIRMIRVMTHQDFIEGMVDNMVGSNVDDDMVFPEETWAEAADRMEPDYPAVAVVLRFAQERRRELDPILIV